jgi:hypothetical protein
MFCSQYFDAFFQFLNFLFQFYFAIRAEQWICVRSSPQYTHSSTLAEVERVRGDQIEVNSVT